MEKNALCIIGLSLRFMSFVRNQLKQKLAHFEVAGNFKKLKKFIEEKSLKDFLDINQTQCV